MLKPYQNKIIDLLIRQELLLARLYSLFAEKFPSHREFWQKMAHEEKQHGKWIKELYEAEQKDLIHFDEGKVKTSTMQTFIAGLEELISRTEEGKVDCKGSFIRACDMERSLIEKNVFLHFSGQTDKASTVLKRLNMHTKRHLQEVEEAKALFDGK